MDMKEMKSEIVIDLSCKTGDENLSFPARFENIQMQWCSLLEHAFELGQRNPFAQEFMVQASDGGWKPSDELSKTRQFYGQLLALSRISDHFFDELQLIWNMAAAQVAQEELDVQTEEPINTAWRIASLEHALSEEKAWSEKLDAENRALKEKLGLDTAPVLQDAIKQALVKGNS